MSHRQTGSQDGLAFTVVPIQLGDIWGQGCGHQLRAPGVEAAVIRCQPPASGTDQSTREDRSGWRRGRRGFTRVGLCFKGHFVVQSSGGGLARQDKELASGNVKPANRAPSYGSGRSLRRKRRRGVTSPSCQAPTFPETPRPGKQRFRAAARGRQPRGDLPAPYLTAPRCRPRGKHRSETGSGTGNNRSVLCTEDSGQPQPRKPRNPPPEGCI